MQFFSAIVADLFCSIDMGVQVIHRHINRLQTSTTTDTEGKALGAKEVRISNV